MAQYSDALKGLLDGLIATEPEIDLGPPVDPGMPHLPVVIIIDTSESMSKMIDGDTNINRVNHALNEFITSIATGTEEVYLKIRECGDFCVLSYGNEMVNLELPWTHGSNLHAGIVPQLAAAGTTPMHTAIVEAAEMMLQRLRGYKRDNTRAYCGAVFNLTDGAPTDNETEQVARAKKVIQLFEAGTSAGIPIAEFHHVGVPGYSEEPLKALSGGTSRIREIGTNMADFFRYITITFSTLAGDKSAVELGGDWRQQQDPA